MFDATFTLAPYLSLLGKRRFGPGIYLWCLEKPNLVKAGLQKLDDV